MHLLTDIYLAAYTETCGADIAATLDSISAIDDTVHNFTFYTSVAVISSSRIEGEQMEVDSYVKHKVQDIEYLPELVEKPNDLYRAYAFARKAPLDEEHFLQAHKLITEHLLPEKWRGVYRKNEMLVLEHGSGRVQFEAAPAAIVAVEMQKLWEDIDELLARELPMNEVFYYAAFIHMMFVCIHPFNDGNGRAARLLEKWFVVQHIGNKAWYIRSEKYYYDHVNEYYRNLNRVGMFYDALDLKDAQPFLQMLPLALRWNR
ncbi:hypothetical protein GCM10023093_24240 [Nemorincola caseinilytica]|uniref:Fido domain-containing protein n=1 Tax=Nemorincola caseinilytica TaxID=2054315 RepID=A0ABP8NLH2_9BACT